MIAAKCAPNLSLAMQTAPIVECAYVKDIFLLLLFLSQPWRE